LRLQLLCCGVVYVLLLQQLVLAPCTVCQALQGKPGLGHAPAYIIRGKAVQTNQRETDEKGEGVDIMYLDLA
jgi:hypothetical protein